MSSPKPPKEVWVLFNQPLVNEPGAFATSVMLPVSNNGPIFHPKYVRYILADQPPAPIVSSPLTDEEKRILAECDEPRAPVALRERVETAVHETVGQDANDHASRILARSAKYRTCRVCGAGYILNYGGEVCGPNGCDNKPKRKHAKKRSKTR